MFLTDNIVFHSFDNASLDETLLRTTHIGIGAHHDDLEIMAYSSISSCYKQNLPSFLGIIITNGENSPRKGDYKNVSNSEMIKIRINEQINASNIGKYSGVIMFNLTSKNLKSTINYNLISDLATIISKSDPSNIITHNPFDNHDSHVCTFINVIKALKTLKPEDISNTKILGSEVWGSLDWIPKKYKVLLDTSYDNDFFISLMSCFKSQIVGGKNYIEATNGRRISNATYLEYEHIENYSSVNFALDLSELVTSSSSFLDFTKKIFIEQSNTTLNQLLKFTNQLST